MSGKEETKQEKDQIERGYKADWLFQIATKDRTVTQEHSPMQSSLWEGILSSVFAMV